MASPARRFGFVFPASVPIANLRMAEALQAAFPDLAMDTIPVLDTLRRKPGFVVLNSLHTLRLYAPEIARRRKRFKEAFYRTPYLFGTVKGIMQDLLSPETHLFSFQMQSLFDASRVGLPHFVYTDHTQLANLTYPGGERNLYAPSWLKMERTIYERASLVFTRSKNISRSLDEQYGRPPEQLVCVYAGHNVVERTNTAAERPWQDRHVLFVGIDWQRKGGPDLVAAFRQVQGVFPDARLTIVGCSPTVDLPNCIVAGRVPVGQLGRYYEAASVFCLPTRLEPFGVVLLEAMAHRLPIVATDIGAVPEFVVDGQSGYLVRPGDTAALARALIDLLGDAHRCRAFGDAGRRIVLDTYTWPAVAERMRDHILPVLQAGRDR